jgi:hypothetical protein
MKRNKKSGKLNNFKLKWWIKIAKKRKKNEKLNNFKLKELRTKISTYKRKEQELRQVLWRKLIL